MNEMLFRTSDMSTSELATLPLEFQIKMFLFFPAGMSVSESEPTRNQRVH